MKIFIEYIKRYKITYFSVVIIFILGMLLGLLLSFKISTDDKKEIFSYIENVNEQIRDGELDKQYIFKENFIGLMKFNVIIWILGCTVIASFSVYIVMIYKGFLFGYIITMAIQGIGLHNAFSLLFPTIILKNIIFLPFIFLLATSGIRMYKGIVSREINIKNELIRHTIIMITCSIIAVIVSCIEAYCSTILIHFL